MGNAKMTQREFERMMKPALTDAQWERLLSFGEPRDVEAGEYLFEAGDLDYDLILVDTGEIEIVRVAFGWVGETHVARWVRAASWANSACSTGRARSCRHGRRRRDGCCGSAARACAH